MIRHFKKLVIGNPEHNLEIPDSHIQRHHANLQKVWNNLGHNDTGIERILRLFLISIQFLFPGLYIRDYFGRFGLSYKNLAIESYILLKLSFPIFAFYFHETGNPFVLGLSIYFLVETITYVAVLVFVSDISTETRSANRAILLLLLNYVEITFNFSMLYSGFRMLNDKAITAIDFFYYSFITSSTIGYGDIVPVTQAGKFLVCCQSFLFLVFVVLFINYFSHHRSRPVERKTEKP
jgi:hypothetical protein